LLTEDQGSRRLDAVLLLQVKELVGMKLSLIAEAVEEIRLREAPCAFDLGR
jgi:hypothetical protein